MNAKKIKKIMIDAAQFCVQTLYEFFLFMSASFPSLIVHKGDEIASCISCIIPFEFDKRFFLFWFSIFPFVSLNVCFLSFSIEKEKKNRSLLSKAMYL